MDIKLHARLSAYSKVDAISNGECSHEYVTEEQIDDLFEDMQEPISVTKSEIDTLFEEVDEPKSVSKKEIDKLFTAPEQPVKSVSYSEIDSLFR